MFNKIVLAGGSGYMGMVLSQYYKDKAKEVVVLSRSKHTAAGNIHFEIWDGKTRGKWMEQLENCDLLINLCGKNVNCRYTKKNQAEILRSRLEPTSLLGNVIPELKNPPKLWTNIASATIYRHAEDRYQDEENGEIGNGFSVEVCKAWEKAFWHSSTPQTRKVILRAGMVLGRRDGVMPRLKNLVQFGVGGKQGSGLQYVSWIHENDLARITEWLYHHANNGDIYNATAPEAVHNKDLMKIMRDTLGISVGLATPQWLLEIGAAIIGTEPELVLKSRWVYPGRLLNNGFQFQFPLAQHAIRDILSCRV